LCLDLPPIHGRQPIRPLSKSGRDRYSSKNSKDSLILDILLAFSDYKEHEQDLDHFEGLPQNSESDILLSLPRLSALSTLPYLGQTASTSQKDMTVHQCVLRCAHQTCHPSLKYTSNVPVRPLLFLRERSPAVFKPSSFLSDGSFFVTFQSFSILCNFGTDPYLFYPVVLLSLMTSGFAT